MRILLDTVAQDVEIGDLDGLYLTHPTSRYDLTSEFTLDQIANSQDLQNLIGLGLVRIYSSLNDRPITSVATESAPVPEIAARDRVTGWYINTFQNVGSTTDTSLSLGVPPYYDNNDAVRRDNNGVDIVFQRGGLYNVNINLNIYSGFTFQTISVTMLMRCRLYDTNGINRGYIDQSLAICWLNSPQTIADSLRTSFVYNFPPGWKMRVTARTYSGSYRIFTTTGSFVEVMELKA